MSLDRYRLFRLKGAQLDIIAQHNPELADQIAHIVQERRRKDEREALEDSLIAFFERSWREFDPAPFKLNWHHEAIAEHLEAVTRGEIRKLLINVPPRSAKTSIVNICWPAWTWAQRFKAPLSGPQVRFMCISYGATLALEIATTARRLIESEWYQGLWGDRVQLWDDQASRENFGTRKGGFRLATSMAGATLGRGADCRIIDDPLSLDQAESAIERDKVNRTYDEALATRETDPSTSCEVVIMQRLHEADLTGHIMEKRFSDFEWLMIPMRYESDRHCVTRYFSDPREAVGDGALMWPDQFPEEVVIERQIRLGEYAFAGQYQQRPSPRAGAIIDRTDWELWPDYEPSLDDLGDRASGSVALPDASFRILSLDTAQSEKETADYNACGVIGIWHGPDSGYNQPRAILTEAWRMRAPLNRRAPEADEPRLPEQKMGLIDRILATARRWTVDRIIIENKSRGIDTRNELLRQMSPHEFMVDLWDPKRHGDKVNRLNSVVPLFAQKLIYAPAKLTRIAHSDGSYTVRTDEFEWVARVIDEVARFPRGEHDDMVDMLTMALIWLRESGMLELTDAHVRESVRQRMFQSRSEGISEHYGV